MTCTAAGAQTLRVARRGIEARAAEQARRQAEEAREMRLAEEARERRTAAEARPRNSRPAREEPAQREAAASVPVPSGGRALPVAGRVAIAFGDAAPGGRHRGVTVIIVIRRRHTFYRSRKCPNKHE